MTTVDAPRRDPPDADERFSQRRAAADEVRRRQRRAVAMLAVMAVVSVTFAIGVVARSGYLDVQSVRVVGARKTSAAAVMRAARISEGVPMIGLETARAALRVERLAWVQRAVIQRRWPNEVVIRVREYEATAWFVLPSGGVGLLGRDGRVLARAEVAPPGLLMVTGVVVAPAVGSLLFPPGLGRLDEALPAALRARVASVDVAGAGARLVLRDGPRVELGGLDALRAKAAAALAVLDARAAAGQCTSLVSVTTPSAPSARGC